jgi:hypothetical protein
MNSYLDQLIDLFLNEEKWDPEAARQKAGNVGMKAGEGREVSPNIKQGASPTIVGDKGVLQVGSGRGRKKKEAGKINKPLSDSIDRLQYFLEDVATEVLTNKASGKTTDDLSDAGKSISKYSNDLEKIHNYLRNNFKTITQMVGGNFQKGIKANLTQGIDGIGRSNAMLVGAVNDANKTNQYGQLVGSDGKQVIGTDGKPIDSDTYDNGYVKDNKWRQKQATQAGGAAPEQTRRAG